MERHGLIAQVRGYLERERIQPDINRGLRATVGFMVPVIATLVWKLPIEISFAATAAQNIAMVDIRGAYPLRVSLLLAMTVLLAGSGWLGGLAAPHFALALAVIVLVTLLSGVWRHLSQDYGPPLAISSLFLTLLALAEPGGDAAANQHFASALAGGLWGVLVQVSLWPFRAQHPLRRAVADSWLAVSDLIEAMAPDETNDATARHHAIVAKEAQLRTALDQTTAAIAAATGKRRAHLKEFEELNLSAARVATRLVALNTSLETLMERPDFAALAPSFGPVFTSFTNLARSVAVTVVSRQPSHLAATEVRLKRLGNLLRALQDRVAAQTEHAPAAAPLTGILKQIAGRLPSLGETLRATVDRANEHVAFSLELLDLKTWTLQPLASALSFRSQPDPALVRFIARLAVLQAAGVAIMHYFHLSRGYWLPLTILVILQPDYGSTRLRAAQRVLGTLTGGALASLLLWLRLPAGAVLFAMAATMFAFAFWLKRNYGIAVFFITLFVVLITETATHVTLAFTIERMLATLGGGLLALLAAQLFWPVWEKNLFPGILARALRANRDYLAQIIAALAAGRAYEGKAIDAKRAAEAANSAVFSSLQRMSGDPKAHQAGIEAAAALANGNQRLTRALTVVAVHLSPGVAITRLDLETFHGLAVETLDELARGIEARRTDAGRSTRLRAALDGLVLRLPSPASPAAAQLEHSVHAQFARAATELSAMLLAAEAVSEESSPPFLAAAI